MEPVSSTQTTQQSNQRKTEGDSMSALRIMSLLIIIAAILVAFVLVIVCANDESIKGGVFFAGLVGLFNLAFFGVLGLAVDDIRNKLK